MVNGHPDRGILPSGQVAGIISDQPTVEALIASIVAEADQAIAELAALAGLSTLASAAATTLNPTQD
jgi:NAD(P)H-dependent flavin oxidoreductase YrpB (nitropropane dioxygenase family)